MTSTADARDGTGVDEDIFLLPVPWLPDPQLLQPRALRTEDNIWIGISRRVRELRRIHPQPGGLEADDPVLRATGAEFCPALGEAASSSVVVSWPESARLRRDPAGRWRFDLPKPKFYRFHFQSSYPQLSYTPAFAAGLGWVAVCPAGWRVMVRGVPNYAGNLSRGLLVAEGIVRSDQVPVPIQVHIALGDWAPDCIDIERGTPMVALSPISRRLPSFDVVTERDAVELVASEALIDGTTFAAAPGRYAEIYVAGGTESDLHSRVRAGRGNRRD